LYIDSERSGSRSVSFARIFDKAAVRNPNTLAIYDAWLEPNSLAVVIGDGHIFLPAQAIENLGH
jgi:reverse gyrase